MKTIRTNVIPLADGARIVRRYGRQKMNSMRMGPNEVHAFITHADGSITDLGISFNLLTNTGRDLAANAQGHAAIKEGAFTASSATSGTPSGGGMTVDAYKGWRVYCPVTALTTAPVYGNVGSNSATVLTVDQWWNAADGAGTTPAATNGYSVYASCTPRFMGLTTDGTAAAAADTVLATEITNNGASRALATYAHTAATATYTLQKAYSITGSITAIHKMGLYTAKDATAAGIMVFESVLNADATVVNGDTLTVTDTVTLS